DGIRDRQRSGKSELRRARNMHVGPQHQRRMEIVRRRYPVPALAAAARGLHARSDQRAFGRTIARQASGFVIGTGKRVERGEPKERRQRVGHPGKSVAATASAPLTTGPGQTMKNRMITAQTNTTTATSPPNGR